MMNKISVLLLVCFTGFSMYGQVGVGTEMPDVNTIMELQSNTKGLLIPRMTAAERDANLADNDPATIYPDNLPVLDPVPTLAADDFLKEGTMIYNTDVKAIQYWDAAASRWSTVMSPPGFATGNDGTVLMNFPEYGTNGAYELTLSPSLLRSTYEWTVTKKDYDVTGTLIATDNTFLVQEDETVFGPEVPAAFNNADFDIAPSPVTRWPDNASDRTKSGIWDNTNKTLIENKIEGQVHFWRIVIQYQVANGNAQKGSLQAKLVNPNSTFQTSNTTSIIDGNGGALATSTFLFVTVADNLSLPNLQNGGLGYELSFSSNDDITISIRSILRISIFKD
jgi:hypothetical protein